MKPIFKSTSYLFLFSTFLFTSFVEEPKAFRPGKDYALFFAIQDYKEWSDLKNPISDAEAVANELKEEYDFEVEIVRNPTKSQIYSRLESYRKKKYAKDDQLFIFFSGHGYFKESSKEGFFIPAEGKVNDPFQSSYIPHTRLNRIIDNLPCNHIFLAIDACYSGTFDKAIAYYDDHKGMPSVRSSSSLSTSHNNFIRRKLRPISRLYLTSGGKERTPDGERYSPFVFHLLKALRDYGNEDGILTYRELLGYMEKANPKPKAGNFGRNDPGGSFIFVADILEFKPNKKGNKEISLSESPKKKDSNLEIVKKESLVNSDTRNQSASKPLKNNETESDKLNFLDVIDQNEDFILYKNGMLFDRRDGRSYKTVKILNRTWMAENLNYDIKGSFCYLGKKRNCEKYGRLYKWEVAVQACPKGWQLPSVIEWEQVISYVRNNLIFNSKAKTEQLAFIKGGNLGLDITFGGYRALKRSGDIDKKSHHWSLQEFNDSKAWKYSLGNSISSKILKEETSKKRALSCRCIKDN